MLFSFFTEHFVTELFFFAVYNSGTAFWQRGKRVKQTIYVDVLLAVNLFINYFLLLATAKFLAVRRLRLRMLAAAALGSAYSLTLLLPEIPVALSLLMKLFMAASLVFLAFPNEGVKRFLKALACFYASVLCSFSCVAGS